MKIWATYLMHHQKFSQLLNKSKLNRINWYEYRNHGSTFFLQIVSSSSIDKVDKQKSQKFSRCSRSSSASSSPSPRPQKLCTTAKTTGAQPTRLVCSYISDNL